MKKKDIKVKSKFKKGSFTFRAVPSKFQSVTDGSVRKTQKYSLEKVQDQFPNYPASALKAMVMSVAGDFNGLYATLEGDRSARETSLKSAYANGYASLSNRVANFQLLVENHNAAFRKYNEVSKELLGEKLSDTLEYSEEKASKLQNKLKELEP